MRKLSIESLKTYFYNQEKTITSRMFGKWLIENEEEEVFDNQLHELWNDAASFPYDQKETDAAFCKIQQRINGSSLPWHTKPARKIVMYVARIASILFIPLLCTTLYLLMDNRETQTNWVEVYAEYGQKKEVILPDKSKIWLNSGTHIVYPERFTNRRQIFVSGEIFLDVTKDADHPFIVDTKDMSIKVYGTKFNVRSYTDDKKTETALLEGSIALILKGDSLNKEIRISPGEKATLEKRQVKLEKFDPDNYQSWRQGQYTFKDKTLAEITTELERIFDVQIIVRDKSLLKESYFVTFAKGLSLSEMLEALNINNTLKIEQDQDIIEITKKQR